MLSALSEAKVTKSLFLQSKGYAHVFPVLEQNCFRLINITCIVHIYPLGDESLLSLQLWGITEHGGFYKDREGEGSTKGQKEWVRPLYQNAGEQPCL